MARGRSFERVGLGIVRRVDETQEPFAQRARLSQSALAALRLPAARSLQQGRGIAEPDEEGDVGIDLRQQAAAGYYENNYANMAAAFVVETERWNLATELFPAEPSPQLLRRNKLMMAALTADTAVVRSD